MMNGQEDNLAITINPATGERGESFAYLNDGEIDAMLSNARRGFAAWSESSQAERSERLVALAKAFRAKAEILARAMTEEMGKPIRQARAEVEKCASTCEWYAENAADLLKDEATAAQNAYVSFLPIGLVFVVTPWNFPLWQIIRATIPALLAGNGVIVKPAPNVLRSAFHALDAFRVAGFPEGSFSIANVGISSIPSIIADDRVAGVALTGSVKAGASIASLAGSHIKHSVLELGGSDPFIVLADADVEAAVKIAVTARFQNTGQVCVAAKRFIIEKSVAARFTEAFTEAVGHLEIGDPMSEDSQLGPMARRDLRHELHLQAMRSVQQGARRLIGEKTIRDGDGYYYAPTVLADVMPGMAAFDEETFGPLAAITVADDAEQAIALANRSRFGLSASLWTADLGRAAQLARRIESGGVFINAYTVTDPRWPVGGTKNSGYGRELSHFGLREFVNAQTVVIGK